MIAESNNRPYSEVIHSEEMVCNELECSAIWDTSSLHMRSECGNLRILCLGDTMWANGSQYARILEQREILPLYKVLSDVEGNLTIEGPLV